MLDQISTAERLEIKIHDLDKKSYQKVYSQLKKLGLSITGYQKGVHSDASSKEVQSTMKK